MGPISGHESQHARRRRQRQFQRRFLMKACGLVWNTFDGGGHDAIYRYLHSPF